MAFTGVLITCADAAFSGAPTIMGPIHWSEWMTVPGEAAESCPGNPAAGNSGSRIFEVYSADDILVSFGPTPDATNGPWVFVKGGSIPYDFAAQFGDKIRWRLPFP